MKYKTTADIKVSKKIVDQVIGQKNAVDIIKKAAKQRRHVFLIGEPGTGKSMLGLALAELLPKEKLVDILSFANPNDENAPLIRSVPAGQGRQVVAQSKLQGVSSFKNQSILLFILVIISMITSNWMTRMGTPPTPGIRTPTTMISWMVMRIGITTVRWTRAHGTRARVQGRPIR